MALDKEQFIKRSLQEAQARFQAGDHARAGALCQQVLRLDKRNPDALHVLAAAAAESARYAEAEGLITTAVRLNPACPHCRNTLGNILRAQGKAEAAVTAYREALRLDPGHPFARLGLAQALENAGDLANASAEVEAVLKVLPDSSRGHALMGSIRAQQRRSAEASEHYQEALRIAPDHAPTRRAFALHLLSLGALAEGWHHFRVSLPGRPPPEPHSGGEAFRGKQVSVYGNQGVGDEILSASCFPDLLGAAAGVTFYCEPRLKALFERSFPAGSFVPFVRETQTIRRNWSPDQVILTSDVLPAYFRPDFAGFPVRSAYLEADQRQGSEWRERLRDTKAGLWVGISWSGGATPKQRRARTIPLHQWLPLLAAPGVNFVSLQHGESRTDIEALRAQTGATVHRWDDPDPLKDLDGFAALISALDLVICVSNTTTHLAGALGTPVWSLLPVSDAWHWFVDRIDSPWYPSMRLFRQETEGDWGKVLERVEADLRAFSARFCSP